MQTMECAKKTADEVLEGQDLRGRTVVVTGANTGIGYAVTKALAARGARVTLACRSLERGRAAEARIHAAHPEAETEVRPIDLASLASVRAFAESFPEPRLDVLVCNAGLYLFGYSLTEDGFERDVGVCHIGHFLLARLLLDRLKAAAPSRVVVVASESHRGAHLDLENLPSGRVPLLSGGPYGRAKLCNVLFAKEWEARYGAQGVHAASLHPGFVLTDIGRRFWGARFAFFLARPFAKTPDQGAATPAWLATVPPAEALGGRYFVDCAQAAPSAEADDPMAARRLWEATERWTGLD